ncbi:hypothetical protein OZX57_01775 [Bifidobacterium sp. ESL0682]|uniref:hypothetical protein n=1 Tax=Bifidobacterium sp. ESL0682 TaxID=2983212 RepID=UPI0023F7A33B|nr:hypothetical protein [Bifidobacterium sp. ESL0682]WEV42245.1 hypothetical protein OZX57_01775 [Bifidobacterium sp. ESL0682]
MENKQAFPILRELRQGDWVNSARLQGEAAKCLSEEKRFENGFVILTQTCDVVSPSKERILLAPVFAVDSQTADDIWRGRRPTKIPLKLIPPELKDGNDWVVDATFAFSLNKQVFEQSYRFYHCVDVNSSEEVSAFSNRIGRVFTRFPFPDEVHDCLRKIQSKVRAAEGKDTKPLAGFLDLTRTIQVSCDDWSKPERQLHFVFVMRSDVINYSEDDGIIKFDSLTKEQVNLEKYGVKKCSRDPKNMSFSDLCSLICFWRVRTLEIMLFLLR